MDPGLFEDIDDATARLAIQLQLEDSKEVVARLVGDGLVTRGNDGDVEFALRLHIEEMERVSSLLQDRHIAEVAGREAELGAQAAQALMPETTNSAGNIDDINAVESVSREIFGS